ncbi:MAG: hypothetical protein CMB56_004775 [Methanobacteriota archaeon]|nr:MAG: hypothetical protein CMB56_004775 [Euryarchaeota archaeon]|tara:strand:- start:4888 stop:5862 length:975 start_codon:yes stop_codon:yes gene_type:complete
MGNLKSSVKIGGHITLIFEIKALSENLDEQGSRGVGICINKGVRIETFAKKGSGEITIDSNQKNVSIKLYKLIIKEVSKKFQNIEKYDWHFKIESDLPFGQGFGCSASGAISAAISILKILNKKENIYEDSVSIAHRVERLFSSGLGDVTGISAGGVELRTKPGLPFTPNNGLVLSWFEDFPILLCWMNDEEKHTSEYINSDKWISRINSAGKECLNILNNKAWNKDIWSDILDQSKKFGEMSGMIKDINRRNLTLKLEEILMNKDLQSSWEIRLCMLGTSAIVLPKNLKNYNKEDLYLIMQDLSKMDLVGCLTSVNNNPIDCD